MCNLFKQPIEKGTLEDWAKLSFETAKISLFAIPVILYGDAILVTKVVNIMLLSICTYFSLYVVRVIRRNQDKE